MHTEIEAKWLNIDILEMRKKLELAGAELIGGERLTFSSVFDHADRRLGKIGGWVRVRNEGDKITLSYKQLNNRTLHGTQEVTVVVDDFDSTCTFLRSIGLEQYAFHEKKRESWKLGDTEIELDTWPWIPSFLEIEAKSEKALRNTAELLHLEYNKALHGSVETAYQAVYDVSEEEIDGWKEIRFIPTPDWLGAKRR